MYWVTNQTSVTLRKLKSYPASFSTTTLLSPEINNKKKTAKNTNTWRLDNQWITEEIKEEIKIPRSKCQQRYDTSDYTTKQQSSKPCDTCTKTET